MTRHCSVKTELQMPADGRECVRGRDSKPVGGEEHVSGRKAEPADGRKSSGDKTGGAAGSRRAAAGALLSLFGGMCWGLSGSMGQYLFTEQGMDARWLVPIRLGLAGVVLFFYCLIRYGERLFAPWKSGRDRRDLLIYGIAGISLCQFLYFSTIQLSTAGVGTILQDLSPIFILLVTCRLEHRRPGAREVLSIVLALIGVFLITTHGSLTHMAVRPAALLTGVLCAVCVMIYNVEPKHLLASYPVTILQAWAFLLGSGILMALFRPWAWGYHPTAMGYFGIAFVVLVGNVLAFTSYMAGVGMIGPNKAILYGFSEPITAAVVGVLLFHSGFTIWDGVGFALVFLMLFLISGRKSA